MSNIQLYAWICAILLIILGCSLVWVFRHKDSSAQEKYCKLVGDISGVIIIPFLSNIVMNNAEKYNLLYWIAFFIMIIVFVWAELAPFFVKNNVD